MNDLLGGKGAGLVRMSRLGLPVAPGFTITTEACQAYMEAGEVPAGLMGFVVCYRKDASLTQSCAYVTSFVYRKGFHNTQRKGDAISVSVGGGHVPGFALGRGDLSPGYAERTED
jgi:phosphoenolpyruvate synthase/pyruvate phosphate dikinase